MFNAFLRVDFGVGLMGKTLLPLAMERGEAGWWEALSACSSQYISKAMFQGGGRSSLSTNVGDAFLNQNERGPNPRSGAHLGVL